MMWTALAIGVGFGWALERAGLGSARKLVGQFYFVDLAVLKVMFTAIVTALLGSFWLGWIGVLDLSAVAVPDTVPAAQAVGGLIFGVGLASAGLCPGTSCVAAASGRLDGLAVMAGMCVGVLGAGLGFAGLQPLYESGWQGSVTLPALFHVPYGVVVGAVVGIALLAFGAVSRLEART